MRIAVVANTAWYLFNFRLSLMKALQAVGHNVVAIASADGYEDRIQAAGIEFDSVKILGSGTNPWTELRTVLLLRAKFARHCSDVVLSYTPKGNLYSGLALASSGAAFVPNISGLGRAFIRESAVTWVVKAMYRLVLRRAFRVIFQNEDDLALFVSMGLVPVDLCERLPGSGVDLLRFAPAEWVSRAPDAPVFLLVARMLWDKGVGEYVQAARQVRARFPEVKFRLLGPVGTANPSAISHKEIDGWVREGVLTYSGVTDDVRPFLADADCIVLPSYREGVPRTLLEAAAMARPLITTDAPGCRDTVRDGDTGFVCRPADAQDLADKLMQFVHLTPDQRQALGRKGRLYMESKFDEQVVIGRYKQLIKELNK